MGGSPLSGEDKMKNITLRTLSVVVLVAGVGSIANAVSYRFNWDGITAAGINSAAGKVETIKISYDVASQEYSFESLIKRNTSNNRLADGFWLVTSNGPDPKGIANQLPIFYFDASGSTPTLSAFNYNGLNGHSSFQNPGQRIATYSGANVTKTNVNANSRLFKFNIPGSVINSFAPPTNPQDWEGLAFADKIGIWYHPVDDLVTNYSQGKLNKFNFSTQSWVDGSNYNTEVVPEPATMLVLAAGLAALAKRRKN